MVELLFTDDELGFLGDYARKLGMRGPEHLVAAVRLVAHLGGYRDRKHDPGPGQQIMWHGHDTLAKSALGQPHWFGDSPASGPLSVIPNPAVQIVATRQS